MFQRIGNSWELVKASARVLRSDKELLVFPLVSSIGVVLVTLVFIFPFLIGDLVDSVFSSNAEVFGTIIAFAYYVVQYTVVFFANTALVGAAMIRLEGGDPTLRDGVQIATKNFLNILAYALIAATVGMILDRIREAKGNSFWRVVSKWVINFLGIAWNIATFLVVPVLAVEGVGPIEAIKRSANMVKETWGEQIAGSFGMGAITALVVVAIIIGGVGLGVAMFALDLGLIPVIAVAVLTGLALVAVGLVSSTLNGIYTAALYQYAVSGEAAEGFFDTELVQNAFRR